MKYIDNKYYLLLYVLYCDWLPTLPQYATCLNVSLIHSFFFCAHILFASIFFLWYHSQIGLCCSQFLLASFFLVIASWQSWSHHSLLCFLSWFQITSFAASIIAFLICSHSCSTSRCCVCFDSTLHRALLYSRSFIRLLRKFSPLFKFTQ